MNYSLSLGRGVAWVDGYQLHGTLVMEEGWVIFDPFMSIWDRYLNRQLMRNGRGSHPRRFVHRKASIELFQTAYPPHVGNWLMLVDVDGDHGERRVVYQFSAIRKKIILETFAQCGLEVKSSTASYSDFRRTYLVYSG